MKCGTVTIVGRPNSGKSTLLNSLVGQKISIVSPTPQTTRHRILGILSEPRGQIVFADTPGIHRPEYRMNRRMQRTVTESLLGIDMVLLIVDGAISFGAGETFALDLVKNCGVTALLLINKIDKMAKPRLLPVIQRYSEAHQFLEIIPIAALTGENLGLLIDKVFEHLPDGAAMYGPELVTDRTERFLTAEFIREKILEFAREEVPYTTAVLIRKFDESLRETKKLVKVDAEILVEKRSQQGIIIGKEGSHLRDIGSAARRDIEQMLGCKLFLNLVVRTAPKWRNDDTILDNLEV